MSRVILLSALLVAVSSFERLGGAMQTVIDGSATSTAAPSNPSIGTTQLAAGAVVARVARLLSETDVARVRSAANKVWKAEKRSTQVQLEDGRTITVGAIPRYQENHLQKLQPLLDEAWDEAVARGFFQAPEGRVMVEFAGMDSEQRAASRMVYAPEGTISVYMHGSPSSLSRKAIVLDPAPNDPMRWQQRTTEMIRLNSGERESRDVAKIAITAEDVADRLQRAALPDGAPLILRACSAGGCPTEGASMAQHVANKTNRPVIAASEIHWRHEVTRDGVKKVDTWISGDTGAGEWRIFLPESWHDGLPTKGKVSVQQDLRGPHELALLRDGSFSNINLGSLLRDFAGTSNRGAIVQAAEKLKVGGKLKLRWSASAVERARERTQTMHGGIWYEAARAEEAIAERVRYVDPRETLSELDATRFRVQTEDLGDITEAVVHRLP